MLVAASCGRLQNDHSRLFQVARMCKAIGLWSSGMITSGKVHATMADCIFVIMIQNWILPAYKASMRIIVHPASKPRFCVMRMLNVWPVSLIPSSAAAFTSGNYKHSK